MTWGDAGTAITAMGMSAGATLAFRVGGELRVAVVVKATFILAPDGPMLLADPDPIVRRDQLRDGSATSSLVASADLVPYRPRADVLLQGHARAPLERPTPAMAVRLMVARGADVVLDKRLAVRGTPDPGGQTREPTAFAAMQLAWELAAATPDNPVGIRETAHAWPHIVDPRQRDRAAGFGPLSPRWPPRQRLLKLGEGAFAARIPELPRDFVWSYFNAAPDDQQVDFFRGDEWVGFEGMSSQLARVQSYLPGVVGRARVYGPQGPSLTGQPVPLEADTVIIDTDRLRCSVVWRGSFPMRHEKYLPVLQVFAGVETAEHLLSFPAAYSGHAGGDVPGPRLASTPPPAPAGGVKAPPRSAMDFSRTLEMAARPVAAATPFGPSSAPPQPVVPRRLPAATPFEGAHLAPAPLPTDTPGTTDLAGLAQRRPARAPAGGEEQTADEAPPLHLGTTLPGSASPSPALPFRRSSPPGPPVDLGSTLGNHEGSPSWIAGKVLPFSEARPPSTPPPAPAAAPPATAPPATAPPAPAPPAPAPPATARKAFDAGRTMAVPAYFSGDALPFAGAAARPGAAPPSPVAAPPAAPPVAPPAPTPIQGGTMTIDMAQVGTALPFAGAAPAAPIREAPPAFVAAPAEVPTYAPVAPVTPAPTTFAPVPHTFAPVAPPSPALLRALEPVPEAPPGEAPQTLGAFFLAAMARAAKGPLGAFENR